MSAPAPAIRENPQLDLAALRRLKYDELERLYRAAKPPSALSDLNGDAVGAMLAWRTPRTGPLAWLLRTFGESSIFAWKGKSFQSLSADSGEGINRVIFFWQAALVSFWDALCPVVPGWRAGISSGLCPSRQPATDQINRR
jgi:hypothetical protein